jgi:hypothetical protein
MDTAAYFNYLAKLMKTNPPSADDGAIKSHGCAGLLV